MCLLVDTELQSAGVALSVLVGFCSTHSRAKATKPLCGGKPCGDPEEDWLALRHCCSSWLGGKARNDIFPVATNILDDEQKRHM